MRTLLAACAASALAAAAAFAHHSPAAYDMSGSVTIDGTVSDLVWRNPHIYVTVETTAEDGTPTPVSVEVAPISTVQTTGLRREHLAPGSHVVIVAAPHRTDPSKAIGRDVTLDDGSILPLNPSGRRSDPVELTAAESLAGAWAPQSADFLRLAQTTPTWPLTPAARAAQADARAVSEAAASCTSVGVPQIMVLQGLRVVTVGESEVTIDVDSYGVQLVRTVRLDMAEHPADLEPSELGHSIGRWEGETLVIDTVGFTPNPSGIGFGFPAGTGKRLTERLTLSEDRRHADYSFTLEDPEFLTEPVSFESVWDHHPELELTRVAEPCDPEVAARFLGERE